MTLLVWYVDAGNVPRARRFTGAMRIEEDAKYRRIVIRLRRELGEMGNEIKGEIKGDGKVLMLTAKQVLKMEVLP